MLLFATFLIVQISRNGTATRYGGDDGIEHAGDEDGGRPASNAPADAAGKVLGVEPKDEKGEARFATLVHWGYGTGWGTVRGLIGAAGLKGLAATSAHLGAVWSAEQVMLPALDVAPSFWTWGAKEVGIDAFHHLVYATATSAAYAVLDR